MFLILTAELSMIACVVLCVYLFVFYDLYLKGVNTYKKNITTLEKSHLHVFWGGEVKVPILFEGTTHLFVLSHITKVRAAFSFANI